MPKVRKPVIIIAVCVLLACLFSARLAMISYAKSRLLKTFPGSQVSIGGLRLTPTGWLLFSEISIKKPPIYEFNIRRFGVTIGRTALRGGLLKITTPKAPLKDFQSQLDMEQGAGPGAGRIDLADLGFKVSAKDISLDASISANIDPMRFMVDKVDLKVYSVRSGGLSIKDLYLNTGQGRLPGMLSIERIQYNKLALKAAKSKIVFTGSSLYFPDISASICGGALDGKIDIKFDRGLGYDIDITISDLDLGELVNELELSDKFIAIGKITGVFGTQGQGLGLRAITGSFETTKEGGTLTITDQSMLEDIAKKTGQPLEIIEQSFKEYRFDTGTAAISMAGADFRFNIHMEGQKGKRDLDIVLHAPTTEQKEEK